MSVEGRVLVHGQDDQNGRSYLMLEGTDARVHFINYTPEIEEARSRGELRTNITYAMGARPQMVLTIFDSGSPGIPTERPKGTIELIWVAEETVPSVAPRLLVPTAAALAT